MTQKGFALIAGIIFFIVALVHLVRILQGWDIIIVTYAVPLWISWVGFIIAGILAYYGLRFGTRRN